MPKTIREIAINFKKCWRGLTDEWSPEMDLADLEEVLELARKLGLEEGRREGRIMDAISEGTDNAAKAENRKLFFKNRRGK